MKQEWHAPGIGEVHNRDHSRMIYCYKIQDGEEIEVVDDDLARQVCAALAALEDKEPK